MLVIVKAILHERTVTLVRAWSLGKVWEDLSLEATAVNLSGGKIL